MSVAMVARCDRPRHRRQKENSSDDGLWPGWATIPVHDRDALVTNCEPHLHHCKKINIPTVLAGQKLGLKEVDDGIWLISFMHYDLGYFDLEQRTLQTIDNPFGTRLSPMC
ncbi:hypothetical protein IE4872_CH04019 [Rhizobium gallicum]|uniref:Uncharacterized protein n=1 Tax=Rhizobium gallicum TaxID=56730 RepID=A0A1L5NNW4_9HYPH|nr:hypothetical protein IE4872_CH04019 [Rhizobium gallicum]